MWSDIHAGRENTRDRDSIAPICLTPGVITEAASVPDLRERIVRHCSPTLAGLKCGSLFRVESDHHSVCGQFAEIRGLLEPRGIEIVYLRSEKDSVLIYLYRPFLLDQRLHMEGVRDFLMGYGYEDDRVEGMVSTLIDRFAHCPSMPPEVGIFLDYPLEDVRGYIENQGRCCRCIGCWKVYGDVDEAERRFTSYKKCREVYVRKYSEGSCISRLAIRA